MPAKLTCIVPSHTTLQLLCFSGQSSRDALPFVLSELHLSKVNEHKGSGLTISRRNSFSLCKKMLLDLHAGASFRGNAERPVSPPSVRCRALCREHLPPLRARLSFVT